MNLCLRAPTCLHLRVGASPRSVLASINDSRHTGEPLLYNTYPSHLMWHLEPSPYLGDDDCTSGISNRRLASVSLSPPPSLSNSLSLSLSNSLTSLSVSLRLP